RVHALGRRAQRPLPPVLRRHDVELDPARGLACRSRRRLDLTPKELAVLRILLAADGAIVSAEELLERAWDENADPFTNTVRMTVSPLRRKLGEPPLIETVTGVGYVIRRTSDSAPCPGCPSGRGWPLSMAPSSSVWAWG